MQDILLSKWNVVLFIILYMIQIGYFGFGKKSVSFITDQKGKR